MRSALTPNLLLLTVLSLTGCSAIIGRAPSPAAWKSIDDRAVPPADACTEVGLLPYAELVSATLLGVMGMVALASDIECQDASEFGDDCLNTEYRLPAFLGLATTGLTLSAVHGMEANEKCGRYRASWDAKWGDPGR